MPSHRESVHRYPPKALAFDHLTGTPIVLGNPTVIQGIGVTHLRYPVRKT